MKKLLAFLLLLVSAFAVLAVANTTKADAAKIPGGTKLYLTPNANWKIDNARFAAYFFGDGEAWVSMTKVANETDLYEVTTPANKNFSNVIFCRMNPSASANNWNNKWNQTADLTFDGVLNHYTVKEGTWDKGGGTWDQFPKPEVVLPHQSLTSLVSSYFNEGLYVRNTTINMDTTNLSVMAELYNAFHAHSLYTERTTYFYPDNELWMTNAEGTINSGYGTAASGEMNHFYYENGVKVVDYTVAGTTGMEDYYTTLKDIVIAKEQGWAEENGVYKSEDADLIDLFLDFTAPCFLNFNSTIQNYFVLEKATVEETSNGLVLKLHVSGTNSSMVNKTSGSDELVLSYATIASNTYRHDFVSGDLGTDKENSGVARSVTLSGKNWIFTPVWRNQGPKDTGEVDEDGKPIMTPNANGILTGALGFDNRYGRGLQIGSEVQPADSIILTTPYVKNIQYIKINTSSANGAKATCSVYINGIELSEKINITSSASDYLLEAETPLSGKLEIVFEQDSDSSKALYINTIELNPTVYTISYPEVEGGTITGPKKVLADVEYTFTISPDAGYLIGNVCVNNVEQDILENSFTTKFTSDSIITVEFLKAAAGQEIKTTYKFADYPAGTQYANETHELDENTILSCNKCHFTSELRIYSSAKNNGIVTIESTNIIRNIEFNAGYEKDILNVYGSVDGVEYTLIEAVSITSTYKDYSISIINSQYKFIKLDVEGTGQVRLKTLSLTTITE